MEFTKPWRVHYARSWIVSTGLSNVWGPQTWKSVSPSTTQSNTVHSISMLILTHTSQNISVTFSLAKLQVIKSSQEVNCKLSKAAETIIYNAFLTSPNFYHNVYKAFYPYASWQALLSKAAPSTVHSKFKNDFKSECSFLGNWTNNPVALRPVEHTVLNLHLTSLTTKRSIVNRKDNANNGQPL